MQNTLTMETINNLAENVREGDVVIKLNDRYYPAFAIKIVDELAGVDAEPGMYLIIEAGAREGGKRKQESVWKLLKLYRDKFLLLYKIEQLNILPASANHLEQSNKDPMLDGIALSECARRIHEDLGTIEDTIIACMR